MVPTKFCLLWQKCNPAGQPYYTGRLGGVRVMVLPVPDHERVERGPTYVLQFANVGEIDTPAALVERRQRAEEGR